MWGDWEGDGGGPCGTSGTSGTGTGTGTDVAGPGRLDGRVPTGLPLLTTDTGPSDVHVSLTPPHPTRPVLPVPDAAVPTGQGHGCPPDEALTAGRHPRRRDLARSRPPAPRIVGRAAPGLVLALTHHSRRDHRGTPRLRLTVDGWVQFSTGTHHSSPPTASVDITGVRSSGSPTNPPLGCGPLYGGTVPRGPWGTTPVPYACPGCRAEVVRPPRQDSAPGTTHGQGPLSQTHPTTDGSALASSPARSVSPTATTTLEGAGVGPSGIGLTDRASQVSVDHI